MRKTIHILLCLCCVWACSKIPEEAETQQETDFPDQESWNSEIVLTKEGRKNAIIVAGHLLRYQDRSEIFMDDTVCVDFYNAEQSHLSHLISLSAEVNEQTNDLVARGNVSVESDSGVTLYTEEIRWNHKEEKIVSEVEIMLVTDQDTLTGIGFESDSNLENWLIRQPSGVTDRELED